MSNLYLNSTKGNKMGEGQQNGWNEYSRLVLKELETLAGGIESLRQDVSGLREELVAMKQNEDKLQELRDWKAKVDDVASPPQLREALQEIDELKLFKTKAVTVFMGVQFLMAAIVAWSQVMG